MAKKNEMTLEQLEKLLFGLRSDKIKENIIRMGVPSQNVIGVATDEIRKLAKKIVKDDDLAYKLWEKNIHEYRLLATLLFEPEMPEHEIYILMKTVDNWALCDHMCKSLIYNNSTCLDKLISEWVLDQNEYVRRAAFVLISMYAFKNGDLSDNNLITKYLGYIHRMFELNETRLYVKKAVLWALRDIAKSSEYNRDLAVSIVKEIISEGGDISKLVLNELENLVKVKERKQLISRQSKTAKKNLGGLENVEKNNEKV